MTQIWAHRGARTMAPENTVPAFELALAQGAEGVEFDVQLTADRVPVVIHDETLERTTDGRGRVCDHTLAQLRLLDASAGFIGHAGTRIPTLDEVLAAVGAVTVNIELKNNKVAYPGLEEIVLAAVDRAGLADQVVLSSFNPESLRRLRALGAPSPLATVFSDRLLQPWRVAQRLGATAIHPHRRLVLGRGYVRRAHAKGIAVRPWVVNRPRDLRRMFRLGVDAVFTDVPDVALALRDAISLTP